MANAHDRGAPAPSPDIQVLLAISDEPPFPVACGLKIGQMEIQLPLPRLRELGANIAKLAWVGEHVTPNYRAQRVAGKTHQEAVPLAMDQTLKEWDLAQVVPDA